MAISILMVGIGGYASVYLDPLLSGVRPDVRLTGCVDPYPEACPRIEEIRARNIPLYPTMAEFFAAGHRADLCVISTPIHLHAPQMLEAIAHGCHVLCEKPLCGDVRDIPALIRARDEAGVYLGIGYQIVQSPAFLTMKRDILNGLWGAPKLLKTIVNRPSSAAYFQRTSGWAGKIRSRDGKLILDSVANNSGAHYLHNILFALGEKMDTAAQPLSVRAALWRAYPIETFDTCAIEMELPGGARGLYIASQVTERTIAPIFDFAFEKGRIRWENGPGGKLIRGVFADGTEKVYGDPMAEQAAKLWHACDAVLDPALRPLCGLEASISQTHVIARIHEETVQEFPKERIRTREDGSGVFVDGLHEQLSDAYASGVMWWG